MSDESSLEAPTLTEAELEAAAVEAGLSPAEFKSALAEQSASEERALVRAGWAVEKKAALLRSAATWSVITALAAVGSLVFHLAFGVLWVAAAGLGMVGLRAYSWLSGPSVEEVEYRRIEMARARRKSAPALSSGSAGESSTRPLLPPGR